MTLEEIPDTRPYKKLLIKKLHNAGNLKRLPLVWFLFQPLQLMVAFRAWSTLLLSRPVLHKPAQPHLGHTTSRVDPREPWGFLGYLEDVKRMPFTDPNVERATNIGMRNSTGRYSRSAKVCKTNDQADERVDSNERQGKKSGTGI